jgi:magnesium chelatase family protein
MLSGGPPLRRVTPAVVPVSTSAIDLADVRGQIAARAALEVAVAGGHNLLLVGSPGIGKSMLARRIPTILPPLEHDEALAVTQVYSAIGAAPPGLLRERPFRSPHHSVSAAALLGGGTMPRPGEITLAHHGVLFLDELPEFQRSTVESLRQPLEDREVVIGRAHATVRFPASFLFVAAANPCPCGWAGSRVRECTCSAGAIERYRARLSGPMLDRIDLHVHVPPVALTELRGAAPGESSADVRARVIAARARQRARLAPWGVATNAEMGPKATRATCELAPAAEAFLTRLAAARRSMSARTIDRLIKVSRTIADLAGADRIERPHLAGGRELPRVRSRAGAGRADLRAAAAAAVARRRRAAAHAPRARSTVRAVIRTACVGRSRHAAGITTAPSDSSIGRAAWLPTANVAVPIAWLGRSSRSVTTPVWPSALLPSPPSIDRVAHTTSPLDRS